jgi:iron-sulfur cluster assembly protein
MVTVTEKAATKIRKELEAKNEHNRKNNLPDMVGFRLAIKSGGCHGLQYAFYPIYFGDDKHDAIYESRGIKIYVDRKSLVIVEDTEIDHNGNLLEGFIFNNPRAKSSCGCGTSFELK